MGLGFPILIPVGIVVVAVLAFIGYKVFKK